MLGPTIKTMVTFGWPLEPSWPPDYHSKYSRVSLVFHELSLHEQRPEYFGMKTVAYFPKEKPSLLLRLPIDPDMVLTISSSQGMSLVVNNSNLFLFTVSSQNYTNSLFTEATYTTVVTNFVS
jgi:hypothetical protein